MIDYRFYFILDLGSCQHVIEPEKLLEQVILGGVTVVQLRAEGFSKKRIYSVAKNIKPLLDEVNIPLIINNEADIALAVDAAGVHVGQNDLPIEVLRDIMPQDKIIGLSISNQDELNKLADKYLIFHQKNKYPLINYLGIGPVFTTQTKLNASPALGIEGTSNLINSSEFQSLKLPYVAIGGISIENLSLVKDIHPKGVAVISAITMAKDPLRVTQQLSQLLLNGEQP